MKKPSYLINSIMFAIADAIYYRDDITAFHKRKEMIYTVSLFMYYYYTKGTFCSYASITHL